MDMSRWKKLAWAAALFYLVLHSINWSALTHRAEIQTESLLDYAMRGLDSTVNGAIDAMLMHAADSIVSELGKAGPQTAERMALIARQRDLDEINIVTREGTIVASTDSRLIGANLGDNPKSAPFLALTNGNSLALSQPFRQGAHNPDVRRKYLGVGFPEGEGFVQCGVDESRMISAFPSIMGFLFDEWILGETGFFLCADMGDGHLVSNPARHRDEAAFLAETGYDTSAPQVVEDGRTTFKMRLFGDLCDCRAMRFCGHRVIAALPPAEYYTTRTFYAVTMAIVVGAVLLTLVLLVRRIDIDSARIQEFYAKEEESRARDFAIAATIQNAALPGPLPANDAFSLSAAMHPAREVGGDFYDYFQLDPAHVAFLVADVSGKGITAALYMMTAKTLIKETLLDIHDPAEALTKANAELCANNPANMFITAWVGVLDLETGVVTYANAGHNPPLKVKGRKPDCGAGDAAERSAVEFITSKSGPVLAFLDGVRYRPFSIRLMRGESLFLYTDGVTEALDASGALFGEERLRDALRAAGAASPASLCMVVRAAVTAFAEGTAQADDITVLAIRNSRNPDHPDGKTPESVSPATGKNPAGRV